MLSKKLLSLLIPTPFKVGCLIIAAACLYYHSFADRKPDLLAALDNRIFDAMFRFRGAMPTTGQVIIVDINEKSLAEIGQWPWPRRVLAGLVDALKAADAKVIGFDIVFPEPDRSSPKNAFIELNLQHKGMVPDDVLTRIIGDTSLDFDLQLGKALAASPSVLGYVFQMTDDGLKNSTDRPFPASTIRIEPNNVQYDDLALGKAYRSIINIPDVAQAVSEGFFNVFPDTSGTVRQVPLFIKMDAVPYPSLALEMIRVGLGAKDIVIHASQQKIGNQRSILGVSLENHIIHTNETGQITVNYRGPNQTFPYLAAVDIIAGKHLSAVRDKYVIIGTTAAGLHDLRATAFSSAFPGVEVHATIIDNILANNPYHHDIFTEISLTYMLIVFGGLLLTALLAFTSPIIGGFSGLFFILATTVGNYYVFFCSHKQVGIIYPLLTIGIIFSLVTLVNYFLEGRKKKFIHDAFAHYVSPQVIGQLMNNPARLTLAGEEKTLTVLLSDIRGFSTLSEKMTPEQLGSFMNEYFTAMSDIIMKHHGMVDKFIGDAIMAVWGAPLDDPDHAKNALKAAFEMLHSLEKLRSDWQNKGMPWIDIGVGLNTGLMSVGNFGSAQRFDYTVMGDSVNLAFRLEGLNKTYGTKIIISEFTRKKLGPLFFCRQLDVVRVKGKKEPVAIYEPLLAGEPDLKLKNEVERFEQALADYHAQNFSLAYDALVKLEEENPAELYKLYLCRLYAFRKQPPPPDWDGVCTFTTK